MSHGRLREKGKCGFSFHRMNELTEEVDNAVVVASEEADQIAEEEQEGRVDDAVGQIVGRTVKLQQGVYLALKGW